MEQVQSSNPKDFLKYFNISELSNVRLSIAKAWYLEENKKSFILLKALVLLYLIR